MAKINSAELFPILNQQPTGIARMAAEAKHADDGHLIEFKALEVRSILNRNVSRRTGYTIGIITKSRLIVRDLDVLTEVARHNRLIVHITITTPDAVLARLVEPRAPRPDLRFAAVRKLRDAGITTGILCSPLLPGLNDGAKMLDEMGRRASEARASFFASNPLFLKLCSRPTYLSFVREHFPALEADYRTRFADRDFSTPKYRRQMAELVSTVCHKYGLGRRLMDVLPEDMKTAKKTVDTVTAQQRLFA